jgi:hypothetical protein
MDRIIVTVKAPFQAYALDLEVPTNVPAGALADLLARSLGGPEAGAYALAAAPPGRLLQPEETLAEAGVWSGAWLVLVIST